MKAYSVTHEWQTDSLAAASADNAAIEGEDATAYAPGATTRLSNVTQIMEKAIVVSGTQRAVRTAGRKDDFDYLIAKVGRELKRDVEAAVSGGNNKVAGDTATARKLAGVETWLATNKLHLAATSTTPGAGAGQVDGNVVSGSTAAALKARVDTVIQQCWSAGGDPGTILAPPLAKKALSAMSGIATQYRDIPKNQQGQIVAGADLYISDFGSHTIIPSRFMRTRTILFLDFEYFALAELRPMQTIDLAVTGDADKAQMLCEVTLEARNEASSGKIADFQE